jgi:mannose-6-phosphate isomerase-like protein (cupin superfamily)
VAPGASTPSRSHEDIGEAYYVLNGSGTVAVGSETAPVVKWDAIPVGLDETSSFANTGDEPLELLVMGVARDMETKLRFMSEGNRQR